jgi:hypothetical protein
MAVFHGGSTCQTTPSTEEELYSLIRKDKTLVLEGNVLADWQTIEDTLKETGHTWDSKVLYVAVERVR